MLKIFNICTFIIYIQSIDLQNDYVFNIKTCQYNYYFKFYVWVLIYNNVSHLDEYINYSSTL